jgi:heme-degrading monooxygenase HmoA
MYAVIFRAQTRDLDDEYTAMAARMRELARSYGCVDFISLSEGDTELTISYWDSKEQILAWRQNEAHRRAQALGREKWYRHYQVQIVKIVREYQGP